VQAAGGVLLDDETQGAALPAALAQRRFVRLGGDAEVALATVLVELPGHALLGLAPAARCGFFLFVIVAGRRPGLCLALGATVAAALQAALEQLGEVDNIGAAA